MRIRALLTSQLNRHFEIDLALAQNLIGLRLGPTFPTFDCNPQIPPESELRGAAHKRPPENSCRERAPAHEAWASHLAIDLARSVHRRKAFLACSILSVLIDMYRAIGTHDQQSSRNRNRGGRRNSGERDGSYAPKVSSPSHPAKLCHKGNRGPFFRFLLRLRRTPD